MEGTEYDSENVKAFYLEKGDAVKIVDRSDEKFEIDGESWYWYEVETTDEQTGWVYGKYLDIENE